ncbi:hypothetical protein [Magnetospirillum fulvum]|uniref:Uncharacterized protein n=1 Tax=Magnetospirillum fulvum MGU-K5 TaxID=1316936 RepID=S9TMJ5_MAGFU|nr:hypothetical protein [Magnetospirillum fulvum]EPY03496.1 hypothetical protein K678_00255 [Magnetospirillum fulvum MGU-K5]
MTIDLAQMRQQRRREAENPAFALVGDSDAMRLEGHDRPWTADELLRISDDLRQYARWLNDRANQLRGEEPDQILVDTQVYESGYVRFWESTKIETAEQAAWAMRQLALAEIEPIEAAS